MEYASHPLLKPNTLELRDYQTRILSEILGRNSLVVLPTGMGKTYLALLTTCGRLSQFPNSRVLFMAPTRPLTVQHYETFKRCLNLPEEELRFLTGEIAPWERGRTWKEGRVFFATPQVVERDLLTGKLSLEDFSLLIFDEAHRAVGDYPYVFIASQYLKTAKNPMILALTASPGGERGRIEEIKKNLSIQCVQLRTEESGDMKPYLMPIRVEWRRVELPEYFLTLKRLLGEQLKEHLSALKKEGYLPSIQDVTKKNLLELQRHLLSELREGKEVSQALVSQAAALKLLHALELLETQGVYALRAFLSRLEAKSGQPGSSRADRILSQDHRTRTVLSLARSVEERGLLDHPKLEECLKCVKEQLGLSPSSRILIFTNFRDTAERLITLLQSSGVRSEKLLGQADREGMEGMTQAEQLRVIGALKRREINVLVCTAVGEEGLDIPDVELVIFYEAVPSEIRAIQRRGRTGRTRPGRVVVLLAKGTRDEAYYWSAVRREREMRKLIGERKLEEFAWRS
jgi:Fanconi anemia group M protein